jgi:hypothetical protein
MALLEIYVYMYFDIDAYHETEIPEHTSIHIHIYV